MARHARLWSLVVALVTLMTPGLVAMAPPAVAADTSAFDPGMIIADEVFFAPDAMSAAQVQAFLDARGTKCVPSSTGVPCLKDYRETTVTRAATAQCAAYQGVANETAAQIIWKSAQACGINPQSLLVVLQKEQGLVNASGSSLTTTRYRSAMGYRCPTGAPCDPAYAGFANQVYNAASRFQYYADNPSRFTFKAGQNNTIAFHPNASCGSSVVRIRNQATAGLYNYTPYQPNAAALAAGYKAGDSCSAYGNRNFWLYFNDWFGPTSGEAYNPVGAISALTVSGSTLRMTGWALDPDTTGPIYVWVTLDGAGRHVLANQADATVAGAYPDYGSAHGWSVELSADPGTHTLCATGSNVGIGSHTSYGCRTAIVLGNTPRGNWEAATAVDTGIRVKGWAFDPDTTGPAYVWATVDGGSGRHLVANASRGDIGRAYPDYGPNHGFDTTIATTNGRHTVCLTISNVGPGAHVSLGCRTVTVGSLASGPPFGSLDRIVGTEEGIEVAGWAIDPDTTGPVYMWVTVDGAGRHVVANRPRPDVGAAYPSYGADHGFSSTLTVTPGPHRVCVTASNVGVGAHKPFGCADVGGSGGALRDVTFQTFTSSAGVPGKYHVFAADVDDTRSVGLLVQFHGDGAYEFDNPTSSYSYGGSAGLRAVAVQHNMIMLAARTPDTVGSPTWWEAGSANADYARDLIQSVVLNRYDIDPQRIWLVGYSGGAQFITRYFLPKYSSMITDGGSVVFGGGGTPAVTVQPFASSLVSGFRMYWYTGAADDGTCVGHEYNALSDAQRGSAYYTTRGFSTGLETPAGVCHNLSGKFGTVVDGQLDRYDAVS